GSKSLQIPQAPPPTFLFLLIFNCQKTDQKNQSKSFPADPRIIPEPPISITANSLGNTRAKDFVASSAAALVQ
ncbi:hypothetical protein, partial [Rhizobium rhizogenes]|uniref:hypothetical protein n=2 Tax=Rhizobium rhizogenes TaxID=359 RepID=UPI001AEE241C